VAKSWRENKRFCEYLLRMNYADKDAKGIAPKLSTGLVAYIWEAWQASAGVKIQGWQYGD